MEPFERPIIGVVPETSPEVTALLDEVDALLESPEPPPRHVVEYTLTSGYARALALEAETRRLERRLGEMAVGRGRDEAGNPREVSAVVDRLADAGGELARLRGALSTLRVRTLGARSWL